MIPEKLAEHKVTIREVRLTKDGEYFARLQDASRKVIAAGFGKTPEAAIEDALYDVVRS